MFWTQEYANESSELFLRVLKLLYTYFVISWNIKKQFHNQIFFLLQNHQFQASFQKHIFLYMKNKPYIFAHMSVKT